MTVSDPLASFAEAHGLAYAEGGVLPAAGGLLGRDSLRVIATAKGILPGRAEGTIAHVSYEYRSNDTTKTMKVTTAVVAVAESIGFAPYLADSAARTHGVHAGVAVKRVEVAQDVKVWADEGIDESWMRELFSPALCDWLARSPAGFGWELSNGTLCAQATGHLTSERELVRLCEDASYLAGAVREESLEEVDSGSAARSAAKTKPDPAAKLRTRLLALADLDEPPANVAEARPVYREIVSRHPTTYAYALFMTLVWTLVINVIGGGIFGLLLSLPNKLVSVAVFELIVLTTVGYFTIRHEINDRSDKLAKEAFWRGFAESRGLIEIDARTFAATHAKAGLPGAPLRVLAGTLGGIEGALMLTGEGLKRGDAIALVRGPIGPTATADFSVSAPGASAAALDSYIERLAAELRESS
jgi:hypothetical protein